MGWLTDKMMSVLEWNDYLSDYVEILETASDQTVGLLNDKLAKIRETDDPTYIEDSLRMMGFELSMFTKENRLKFYDAFTVLPQFHQLHGSPDIYKIIELLLGQNITVEHLYTADYENFYPEPQGRMVYEGGPWYMTSHVKLAVENKNLYGDDADSFIQEAFYKFAPIEEVLESISDLIRVYLRLGVTAFVYDTRRLTFTQMTDILKAVLVCPTKAIDQETYSIHVRLITADAEFTEIPSKLYASEHYSYSNGEITFNTDEPEVTVSGIHRGQMFYTKVSILPSGQIHAPDAVFISGKPTLAVNESSEYLLMGVYGNHRRSIDDQENVKWRTDSTSLQLIRNTVSILNKPSSDEGTTLYAEYVDADGTYTESKFNINIFGQLDPNMPKSLAIWVDDSIVQGESKTLRTGLIFQDRTEDVMCNFTLSTPMVSIDPEQNVLGSEAQGDYVCVILAEYTYESTVYQAQTSIKFTIPKYAIVEAWIAGEGDVDEDSTSQYKCMVEWEDGSITQVSADWSSTLMFSAGDTTLVGSIKADIDSMGVATFPKLSRDSQTVIRAQFYANDILYSVGLPVTIHNVANYIRYVEIVLGSELLTVGQRMEIFILTHWNNGAVTYGEDAVTVSNLYVEYERTDNTNEVSIYEEDGKVYVDFVRGNASTGAKIRCIYNNSLGDTLQTYRPFSLAVQTRSITELEITGPNKMYEGSRIALGCRVKWDTGVWSDIVPEWILDLTNTHGQFSLREIAYILRGKYMTLEEIQADAELSTWDDFQLARDDQLDAILVNRLIAQSSWIVEQLETNPTTAIRAVYGDFSTEVDIEIMQTDEGDANVIAFHYIEGPMTLSGSDTEADYELLVKYDNDCPIQSVSGGWSCDADPDIADIDEQGFLSINSNEDHEFTITATYVCGANDITSTLKVQIVRDKSNIDRVDMIGPDTVTPEGTYNYDVSVIRNKIAHIDTVVDPLDWDIYSDDPIHFETENGVDGVVVVPMLYHDTSFTISAIYTEYDPTTYSGYESATARKTVQVLSTKKITAARVITTDNVKDTDGSYQIKVEVTRVNGDVEILDEYNAPDADVVWRMFSSNENVTMSNSGVLTMERMPETIYVDVQVSIYEGRTFISASGSIRINSQSTPVLLQIVCDDFIRDASSTSILSNAMLLDNTWEDYSKKVEWSIKHSSRSTITIVEGTLVAPLLLENTTAIISCRFEIGDEILSAEKEVTILSSAPKYGVGYYGINTPEECAELTEVMNSITGGTLIIHAAENQYGYFLCRSDLGDVGFIALDNNSVEGWDGANRQSEDYDHITGPKDIFFDVNGVLERWWLFRTNNSGFGSASFAVTFTQ